MYLFQQRRNKNDSILQTNLHSTMYLFQLWRIRSYEYCISYLHSTMYLFQRNSFGHWEMDTVVFTFHYVSISTRAPQGASIEQRYLHSTMYLFQLVVANCISVVIYLHSTMYLFQH